MELDTDDINVKQLSVADTALTQQLFTLLQQVFEMDTVGILTETYLKTLLTNPSFIVFAAFQKNEIVGGLTAYVLPMYCTEHAEVYIYDIAVAPQFQRKGIGKRLLAAIKEYSRQNGIRGVFVQADEADEHALDFYRAAGGSEERVRHFTFRP